MITINAMIFDFKRGVVLLPEADAIPFRSNFHEDIGIQVTQSRSPGFTLTCTRFNSPSNLATDKASIRGMIGGTYNVVERINGVAQAYTGYQFAITQARVVNEQVVPAFFGYRYGVGSVSFVPAVRITAQFTMYAIATT